MAKRESHNNSHAEKILALMQKRKADRYSLEEIANELSITPAVAREAFNEAVKKGGKGTLLQFASVPEEFIEDVHVPKRQKPSLIAPDRFFFHRVRFGATADSHLVSNFSLDNGERRYGPLWDMYRICEREGVPIVFHGGNWIDGHSPFNRFITKKQGITAQVEFFLNEYPRAPGVKTVFIAGDDHEGWWWKREGLDIAEYAALKATKGGRSDMEFIGYIEADVALVPGNGFVYNKYEACPEEIAQLREETDPAQRQFPHGANTTLDLSPYPHYAIMRLAHGGGGTGYAKSYQPQKIIGSYESGEKPQILLLGHYHKASSDWLRNTYVVQLGTTEMQSEFMRKKVIPADVGYWIMDANQAPTGEINRFKERFIAYTVRGFNFDPRAYTIRE